MTITKGVEKYFNFKGDGYEKYPGTYTLEATGHYQIISPPIVPIPESIISSHLHDMSVLNKIYEQSNTPNAIAWVGNPIDDVNQEFLSKIQLDNADRLELMNFQLESQIEKEKCLKKAAVTTKSQSELNFQNFLDVLTDEAVGLALEQMNKYLPSQFQVGFSIEHGENGEISFKGASVGDISYNSQEGTISYGNNIVTSYANKGLESLNKVLSGFAEITVDTDKVTFNGKAIKLDDLKSSGSELTLSNNITLKGEGENVVVMVGYQKFDLGTFASLKLNPLSKGLSTINKILPSQLKTSVKFEGSPPLPVVGIGPLTFNSSNGDLVFDSVQASDMATNYITSSLFSKLPAPVGAIAKAALKAINLPGLLGAKPIVPSPDSSLAIKETCDGKKIPASPPIILPGEATGSLGNVTNVNQGAA